MMNAKELREITNNSRKDENFSEYIEKIVYPHMLDRAKSGYCNATFRIIGSTPNLGLIKKEIEANGYDINFNPSLGTYTITW